MLAFVWWRLSDNTADNDLWGHVLYGQRMPVLGHVEKADPFSWTAPGAPWINHEVLAEVAMGAAHRAAGAAGLWLLAIGTAVVTLSLAWRTARRGAREPGLGLTFVALLAVSANGIALGFSVRPQLFTMLALVLLLGQMRRLHDGRMWPLFALPLLCLLWINTHGGVLAGLLLLLLAGAACMLQRLAPGSWSRGFFAVPPRRAGPAFFAALALGVLACLATPWGPESLRWLIESVRYTRPEITEWRATPFDTGNAPFWFAAALSIAAWLTSRRPRQIWEAATLALLLAMAWRHQRHIPLFCLANLVLTPPHLLDLFRRLRRPAASLVAAFESAGVRTVVSLLLLAGAGAALAASVHAPRQNPFRMEVERDQFPCAALAFLRAHPVEGNLLVFFDWGQQAMWELPDNPVSFDGRLDTVYPHAVIDAHWKFYRGETFDTTMLDLARADIALLPSGSGGELTLRKIGWSPVYFDSLASIWVRQRERQPGLAGLRLPVRGGSDATIGREPFPATPSARAAVKQTQP